MPKNAAQGQAIGVSRGGRSTTIHLATDLLGRPVAFHLTPGRHSDVRNVGALLAKTGGCRRFIADRPHDANALRQNLRDNAIKPVIPGKKYRIVEVRHDKEVYKRRLAVSEISLASPPGTTNSPQKIRDTVALAVMYMSRP